MSSPDNVGAIKANSYLSLTANNKQYLFGPDASLTFPNGGGVNTGLSTAATDIFLTSSDNPTAKVGLQDFDQETRVYVYAKTPGSIINPASAFTIETNRQTSTKSWTFDKTGALTFPDNTVQTTAFTGGFISLSTLKTVVAASTDFADFKTRIAAL